MTSIELFNLNIEARWL